MNFSLATVSPAKDYWPFLVMIFEFWKYFSILKKSITFQVLRKKIESVLAQTKSSGRGQGDDVNVNVFKLFFKSLLPLLPLNSGNLSYPTCKKNHPFSFFFFVKMKHLIIFLRTCIQRQGYLIIFLNCCMTFNIWISLLSGWNLLDIQHPDQFNLFTRCSSLWLVSFVKCPEKVHLRN